MKIKPTVSLCLITKNEEDCITACIQSAAGLVDEIVVVDTGSVDHTVKLAEKLKAKVVPYAWQDDFAAARNFGLDQAAGDWILVLDGDEVLEPVDRELFDRLLAAPGVEGYFLTIRSLLGDGEEEVSDRVVRLFKNNPLYRFEGAIHEQVIGSIKQQNGNFGLAQSGIAIFHTGYLQKRMAAKNKHQRNICVIRRALEAKPDDPFLLYSLGIEFTQAGDIAQGNEFLASSLVRLTGREGYFHHVIMTLGTGLLQIGERERLNRLLDNALIMFPGDPEFCLLKGLTAFQSGDWQAAAAGLRQAAAAATDTLLPLCHIQVLLADALLMTGRNDQAETAYLAACSLAPGWHYPQDRLLELRKRQSTIEKT
ncbi:MAG: glycosyltransferase family 2 protein [Veillonellales bacterium]